MNEWQIFLNELIAAGYTEEGLAKRWGASKRTISRLRKGETQEPRYHLGQAIIMLYYQYKYLNLKPK